MRVTCNVAIWAPKGTRTEPTASKVLGERFISFFSFYGNDGIDSNLWCNKPNNPYNSHNFSHEFYHNDTLSHYYYVTGKQSASADLAIWVSSLFGLA